jgi:hypothetical protein
MEHFGVTVLAMGRLRETNLVPNFVLVAAPYADRTSFAAGIPDVRRQQELC